MPFAVPPGALTILLAQAGAIVHPAPEPNSAAIRENAVIVQADDGFVITSQRTAPPPPRLATVTLGSAVRIDPALLAAGICQPGSDRR